MQGQLLSRGLILTWFAKPPSLPWGAACPKAAHPTEQHQACERLHVMSFPASAAAWEELTQGVGVAAVPPGHCQNLLPPKSFHHAFAPLAFFSHTWKSPGCLEAEESIS